MPSQADNDEIRDRALPAATGPDGDRLACPGAIHLPNVVTLNGESSSHCRYLHAETQAGFRCPGSHKGGVL